MPQSNSKMIPIAVFDISSSSVAGAHALISKNHESIAQVSILASSRVFSQPKEDIDIKRFVEGTLEQLDEVIVTLHKADNHKPKEIHVLLASPWFLSQTRTITYNKTTAFVCNQKLIDSLIEKEISFIMEHDMDHFGSMGKEGVIIEKQISQIKLNGYNTDNPFGKKTQSLEVSLVVTVAPKQIIEKFKEHINKGYGGAKVRFTTSPYATFVVTRDFLEAPNELMIIDIGEEITDIAYVKNELFLYQHSFPVGFYELYRRLASTNHATISETRALIETFHLGKLSASMTSNLQKILEEFGATWSRALQENINATSYAIKIPGALYVISVSPFSEFFNKCLEVDAFITHAMGSVNNKPTTLTATLLSKHISSLDPEQIDDTLAVGVLFASRLL